MFITLKGYYCQLMLIGYRLTNFTLLYPFARTQENIFMSICIQNSSYVLIGFPGHQWPALSGLPGALPVPGQLLRPRRRQLGRKGEPRTKPRPFTRTRSRPHPSPNPDNLILFCELPQVRLGHKTWPQTRPEPDRGSTHPQTLTSSSTFVSFLRLGPNTWLKTRPEPEIRQWHHDFLVIGGGGGFSVLCTEYFSAKA
jgi:hypothetical protein